MTHSNRVVTNPLTREELVAREVISALTKSKRLDILRCLDDESMTASAIAHRRDISRQTASRHLSRFADRGLIKAADSEGYALTAGGQTVLQSVETCLTVIDREQLTRLTLSTHAITLLDALADGLERPYELVGTDTDAPSHDTVRRAVKLVETDGWVIERNGECCLTPAGTHLLDAYDELAVAVEQVMAKAPWFQRLSPARTDVPVHALASAELTESEPGAPGLVLASALNFCDSDIDRFRGLISVYNPVLFESYDAFLLSNEITGEALVDRSLVKRLYEEGDEQFLDDSSYDSFSVFQVDEPLTLGIGLYDAQKVAIGVYNEAEDGNDMAMITSTTDAVVQWGIELYESYREQAGQPTEQVAERRESVTSDLTASGLEQSSSSSMD